jgi:hypothetical protein
MVKISPIEYERVLNWDDAMLYCQLLVISGKNDWRLPTKEELCDIYSYNNIFSNTIHWSSTEYNDNLVWYMGMSYGGSDYIHKSSKAYVRPVRTI